MLIHCINCWSEWTRWTGGGREYHWPLFQVTKGPIKSVSVLQCPGIFLQNEETRFLNIFLGQILSVFWRYQSNHCLHCRPPSLSPAGPGLYLTSTEEHFKLWEKEIFRELYSSPCSHLFKARRQWRLSFYLSIGKFECLDQKIQAFSLLSLRSFEWLHCEALTIMS